MSILILHNKHILHRDDLNYVGTCPHQISKALIITDFFNRNFILTHRKCPDNITVLLIFVIFVTTIYFRDTI